MTAAAMGNMLMTGGCCHVIACVVVRAWMLDGEPSPRWTRIYQRGRRLLPIVVAVIMFGGALANDLSSVMGATAAAMLYSIGGDDDDVRRLRERITGMVTRSGNRLAVKQV